MGADMKLGTAYVEIKGEDKHLKTDLTKAESRVKSAAKNMEAALRKAFMVGFGAAAAGAGLAVIAMKKVSSAAMVQEKAVMTLNAALKASGTYTKAFSDDLNAFASSIQKVTTYGDEEVLQLMALQKNLGVSADRLKDATKMTIGLAAATGRDVRSMAQYVAMAMQGEFTMLRRYIPALRATTDKTEQLRIVTEFAAKGFQVAQEETKTFTGRLKQFANLWGDLKERVGDAIIKNKAIIKLLEDGKKTLLSWIDYVEKWVKANGDLIAQKTEEVIIGIKKAAELLFGAITKVYNITSDLWKIASAVPAGFIEFFIDAKKEADKASESIKKVSDEIAKVKAPELTSWQKFWAYLTRLGNNMIDVFAFMGKAIGNAFGLLVGDIIASLIVLAKEAKATGTILWHSLTMRFWKIKDDWQNVVKIAEEYNAQLGTNWKVFTTGMRQDWEKLIESITSGNENVKNLAKGLSEIEPFDWEQWIMPYEKVITNIKKQQEAIKQLNIDIDAQTLSWKDLELEVARAEKQIIKSQKAMQLAIKEADQNIDAQALSWKDLQDAIDAMSIPEIDPTAQVSALRDMYSDMGEYGQEYTNQVFKLIDMQAKKYKELGIEQTLIDKWVTKEKKNRLDEQAQLTRDSLARTAGNWADFFKYLGKENKAAFKAYKLMAITEAIINTYSAAVAAYKSTAVIPVIGPALAPVAAAGAIAAGLANVEMIRAQKMHTGGIVGEGGTLKTVMPAVFDYAPRAHEGLGPDEVPIIAKKDEGIFTPKQMAALAPVGSGESKTVNIIMNNPTFQDQATQRRVFADIATKIAEQVAPGAVVRSYHNDGRIRSIIRGRA